MIAWCPELVFFQPELVVQVVDGTSPHISALYKLPLAAIGLESKGSYSRNNGCILPVFSAIHPQEM